MTEENEADFDIRRSIHSAVHELILRERERPGWYGGPLNTAWTGLAKVNHDSEESELKNIASNLAEWFEDAELSNEYEIAALALSGKFFNEYERGKKEFKKIEEKVESKLNSEIESAKSNTDRQYQFFDSYIYLYATVSCLESYDKIDDHYDFLKKEIEDLIDEQWIDYEQMAFVELSNLILEDFSEECSRKAIKRMRKVDLGELEDYEIIPTLWFFQEAQDKFQNSIQEEETALQIVEKIRQNLWRKLYDSLPFHLYLTDDAEYQFSPDVGQLSILDRMLGRTDNQIHVFSQNQLEKRDQRKNEELSQKLTSQRRKKIALASPLFALSGLVLAILILNFNPESINKENIPTKGLIQSVFTVELLAQTWLASSLAKTYPATQGIMDYIEDNQWLPWIVSAIIGLISVIISLYVVELLWPLI